MNDVKHRICSIIDGQAEDLIRLSHEIHEHPEPAFTEYRSSACLMEFFEKRGFHGEKGI